MLAVTGTRKPPLSYAAPKTAAVGSSDITAGSPRQIEKTEARWLELADRAGE